MFLVDSHCHLDSLNYNVKTIQDVIKVANLSYVNYFLSVATTLSSYLNMKQDFSKFANISFSCGIHPLNIFDEVIDYDLFNKLASEPEVKALGETGLDYFYETEHQNLQQEVFAMHMMLSNKVKKPIIVHTRSAINDTLSMIKTEKPHSGVLHCFTENKNAAKQLLDLGFYISFSGIVTFKNADSIREAVKYVPLDKILIETDSPYLAPVPYRGKENQPAYLLETAKCIANIKNKTVDELAIITTKNFCNLFNLSYDEITNLKQM